MPRSSEKQTTAPAKQSGWPPDWKDANQYSYLGEATPRQFAWEFLRRNPEYQKLWEMLLAPYYYNQDEEGAIEAAKELANRPIYSHSG